MQLHIISYRDLEEAVEELRADVLSRQCRVQMCDVEGMALVLSHVTKALGELKGKKQNVFNIVIGWAIA